MTLLSPKKQQHLDSLSGLFARTFSDHWEWHDIAAAGYFEHAPYDWETSRIGTRDGQVVTHFGVWEFAMRVGHSTLRVGAVGAVATEREYRGRGLMRQTAEAAMAAMRENGYDLSLLFGIPDYYLRFGFVSSFTQHRFTVSMREFDDGASKVAFNAFDGDAAQLAQPYNMENDGITGTFVRPTFRTNRRPGTITLYTFDGGYLAAGRRDEHLQVADCAGPPQRILSVAHQLCVREMVPRVEFVFLPKRSRMGEHLQRIDHIYSHRFDTSGGPMVKVVNLEAVLAKISPVLSERLSSSGLSAYTGTLRVNGDGEAATLRIAAGQVEAVYTPEDTVSGESVSGVIDAGQGLGRLVLGDDDPQRICRQQGMTLRGDARQLLPVLFPDQEPSVVLWDRF